MSDPDRVDRFVVVLFAEQLDVQFGLRIVKGFNSLDQIGDDRSLAEQRNEDRVDGQGSLVHRREVILGDVDQITVVQGGKARNQLVERGQQVENAGQGENEDDRAGEVPDQEADQDDRGDRQHHLLPSRDDRVGRAVGKAFAEVGERDECVIVAVYLPQESLYFHTGSEKVVHLTGRVGGDLLGRLRLEGIRDGNVDGAFVCGERDDSEPTRNRLRQHFTRCFGRIVGGEIDRRQSERTGQHGLELPLFQRTLVDQDLTDPSA